MTSITVRVDDSGVRRGLKRIGDAIPDLTDDEIMAGLDKARNEVRAQWPRGGVQGYDAPLRRGQRYRRTGNLGASTTWIRTGRSFQIVSNAISPRGQAYSVFVLGDAQGKGQTRIHRGRWPVFAEVVKKWSETMVQNINNALRRLVRDAGMGL